MEDIEFTHYGWYFGIVPIRLFEYKGEIYLETRYCPEFLMDIVDFFVFDLVTPVYQLIDPDYEPLFSIKITGKY